jgi:uncharacterized membrane protein YkvA (DUF1232 family)
MNALEFWKRRARQLKTETYALYLAYQDPRTPWYARLLAICIVAYAFSPIDLIPDFIPVLGYLDDLILLPLGIALALKLIPPPVLTQSRHAAQARLLETKPVNRFIAPVIVGTWLFLAVITTTFILKLVLR